MTTPSERQLQQKRFLRRWWWFDPAHVSEKCETALAWEVVRRTRSYRALWRKFRKQTIPLLQHKGTPTTAGAYQHGHLLQKVCGAVGRPYFDFLLNGFDPELTWPELDQSQRLTARGIVVDDTGAVRINEELLLPRQVAVKPRLSVGAVRLGRDAAGQLNLLPNWYVPNALKNVEASGFFQELPLKAPGQFVYVLFDTRGGRDALLESFDTEMQRWLRTPPPPSNEKMDASYWERVAKDKERMAVRSNPDDGTTVEFWTPETEIRGATGRVKSSEQALIPSDDPPRAIFMVSARQSPARVRAAFHTQLKTAQRKKWHSRCVAFWKTLTIEKKAVSSQPADSKRIDSQTRRLFDAKKHLPSSVIPKRSARRKDPWLGLAANDVVKDRLPLGKSSVEGAFLLEQSSTGVALRNAQRSIARWLKALDGTIGRLDKNLAYWNQQSKALASIGFFEAVAQELR